jgi:hypothetical protein
MLVEEGGNLSERHRCFGQAIVDIARATAGNYANDVSWLCDEVRNWP